MQSAQDNPFEPVASNPIQPAAGASRQPATHPVQFGGSGAEYFRIWIVNVALTLLTLGIYSAWAKVRRLNYFYRQTSLAGSSFEYHGQPMAILKGRILAVLLLFLWNFSPQVHPLFFAAVFVAALIVMPWLVTSALRFRLHNSSYRGLRFSFLGNVKETAKVFYLSILLTVVTLGLAFPYLVWRTKKYFFDHAAYGSLQAAFQTRVGKFFRVYILVGAAASILPFVIFVAILVSFQGSFSGDGEGFPGSLLRFDRIAVIVGAVVIAFLVYLGAFAYIRARIHVLCWNGLEMGEHRFHCDLSPWHFAGVTVRNLLLTALTLGLYKPFSDIQLSRLLAESISFDCAEDLATVVARTQAEERAGGEEAAEFFDMDIGL